MSRKERIEQLLKNQFSPAHIEVIDESAQHHVPKDAQTHIKLILVSSHFEALSTIKRHRLMYQALNEELQSGLHALTMHLFTPNEWTQKAEEIMPSPACKDGYQHKKV